MIVIGKVFQSLETAASAVAHGAAAEIVAKTADSFVTGGTPSLDLRRVVRGGTTAIAQPADQEEKREVDPCQAGDNFNIFECVFQSVIEIFSSGSTSTLNPCNFGNRMCIN